MQFQVPQFTDIEDKIIGPFTLKQFMYLAVGGLIIFILYKSVGGFAAFVLAVPVLGIAIALAFIRINNQPFISAIKNLIGFLRKPDFYVWKKPIAKKEKEEAPQIIQRVPAKEKVKLASKEKLQEIGWKIEVEK